ncbi:MAG TPA: RNA polymerase subunit sigma [Candidatus Latescibacteria bacterium]|jgi:RNA polymerase primary sigma factor|nr:RNA polymerase subunit sigma [Candidatus Latescibacterota bacterium]
MANFNGKESRESMDLYLRDIRKYTPLPREEEAQVVVKARKGDKQALAKLITANLRFVVRVAGEYTNRGLPLQDLIAEGNIGLMRATETFDPSRGHKFITYAVWWIRQAMMSALNKQTRAVKIPVNQIDDHDAIAKVARAMSQELGRQPSLEELAANTQMSDKRVRRAMEASQPSLSMDSQVYADGTISYSDTFVADEPPADERVHEAYLKQLLRNNLEMLPEREAKILDLYYGLETDEPKSLEQVGRRFSISRERVRQIKDRAISRLKANMVTQDAEAA